MNTSDTVLLEKAGGVATLTLNRPDKLNALCASTRERFGQHLEDVAADPEIRVVLIQAAGRAFCAGADTDDLPDSPMAWRDRILSAQRHHLALIKMSKVVLAAVQGAAVGGGASLALAADILVLSDNARLGFPFVHAGLIPDGGSSFLLQAKLGTPVALDLLLTGGSIDAQEAMRLGLTRRVVPVDKLLQASRALAEELTRLPAEALILTKSNSRQAWTGRMEAALAHEADAFALATAMPSHHAALAAARHKRNARKAS